MMNKRGNLFLGVVVTLVLWVFGVLFLPFITDDITTARGELTCTDISISDGVKLNCLAVDLVVPYFIWFIGSIALGYLAGING